MGQRRTSRDERIVPVRLWGMDVSGQPFIEAVWTHNVSTDGALLKGIRRKLQAGDIVGITYAQKKARLRVVGSDKLDRLKKATLGCKPYRGERTFGRHFQKRHTQTCIADRLEKTKGNTSA